MNRGGVAGSLAALALGAMAKLGIPIVSFSHEWKEFLPESMGNPGMHFDLLCSKNQLRKFTLIDRFMKPLQKVHASLLLGITCSILFRACLGPEHALRPRLPAGPHRPRS